MNLKLFSGYFYLDPVKSSSGFQHINDYIAVGVVSFFSQLTKINYLVIC